MSLSEELRTALQYKPDSTAKELAELCPTARDANHIATNLSAFVSRGEVVSTKHPGGANTYAFNLSYTPKRRTPGAAADKAPPQAGKKKPTKKTAKKPRPPRTALAPIPLVEEDTHIVALRPNGAIFVLDKAEGTYSELPPNVAMQLRELFAAGTRTTT